MKNLEYYLSLNYHKMVTLDEDNSYIIKVEELPGCIADGETPNEAFQNLEEAMKSWFTSRMEAGLDIPEPRGEEEYSGRILVRMAKALHRRLALQASGQGVSLNQYIVTLLADASARPEIFAADVGTGKTAMFLRYCTEHRDMANYVRIFRSGGNWENTGVAYLSGYGFSQGGIAVTGRMNADDPGSAEKLIRSLPLPAISNTEA